MQRNEVAPGWLKIQELVDIGYIGPGDSARRPPMGVVRLYSPIFRVLVHGFSERAFANHDNPYRAAVIVNRGSVPGAPAEQEKFGKLAARDQISSVLARREDPVLEIVLLTKGEPGKPVFYFRERGDFGEIVDGLDEFPERRSDGGQTGLGLYSDSCISNSQYPTRLNTQSTTREPLVKKRRKREMA